MRYLLRYPHHFGFNEETAHDNEFQIAAQVDVEEIRSLAQLEFEKLKNELMAVGLPIIVMDEKSPTTHSPDALFPNNWFSAHENGQFITYPMRAINRRSELNHEFIRSLGYPELIAFEQEVEQHRFLEGTGSMVFDRDKRIIYASRSERTDESLVQRLASVIGYRAFVFDAFAPSGAPLYHTNVLMHVGKTYVCVGLDLIPQEQRQSFREMIRLSGKELIELTADQILAHFAGNMLQMINSANQNILLLSENAFGSLSEEQLLLLNDHNDQLLVVPIPTIEGVGGGSVRCMIAELP